ncbi:BREX-1 system adenine-specific DNA-methyltransferase PglX [Aeromonas media]|uniref:BREX-1 system adenine-specific DNA-methyltransferase PglX n=1 Tax=Aeromonas media TaxID=651 RepID=UPI0038D1937A
MSQQENNNMQKHFYRASAADFSKIPRQPIAYWMSRKVGDMFLSSRSLSDISPACIGMMTTDNSKFLRRWWEVNITNISTGIKSIEESVLSQSKWFPYNKGGPFRKWAGNKEYVVNWENEGHAIKMNGMTSFRGRNFYFREGLSWSDVTSGKLSCRKIPIGFIHDISGHSVFPDLQETSLGILAMMNTKFCDALAGILNPTMHFQVGDYAKLPYPEKYISTKVSNISGLAVQYADEDWSSYESSWDFKFNPMLPSERHLIGKHSIQYGFNKARVHWMERTLKMRGLEEENNLLFIEAYGLHDELTPEVPLSEITLTCNPHYRYGGNLTVQERETRLQSDTIAELISYAIGCMMGRYSLDREGLVYAHAGNEGFKALVEEGAYATFAADEDGILPLTSDNWFPDDVAARFEAFIRTVWGAETLEENLQFIADSLCLSAIKPVKKGGETARETIRRYLSTQFFKDHMKTYKKRPIYWLFSSGKEKAFECLVYLHRYNEATLPRMRTEYVTPLLGQMAGRIERLRLQQAEAGTAEAKRIGKEIDTLSKQLTELRAFDDELKHHADMRITLDLDDGVKVNYGKFGTLLSDVKAITGDKGE